MLADQAAESRRSGEAENLLTGVEIERTTTSSWSCSPTLAGGSLAASHADDVDPIGHATGSPTVMSGRAGGDVADRARRRHRVGDRPAGGRRATASVAGRRRRLPRRARVLVELLNPELEAETNVPGRRRRRACSIYDTEMGELADDARVLEAGGLGSSDRQRGDPRGDDRRLGRRPVHRSRRATTSSAGPPSSRTSTGSCSPRSTPATASPRSTTSACSPSNSSRLGVVLAVGFALLFARSTTRPIKELTAVARRAEAGDLDARVDPSGPTELRRARSLVQRQPRLAAAT